MIHERIERQVMLKRAARLVVSLETDEYEATKGDASDRVQGIRRGEVSGACLMAHRLGVFPEPELLADARDEQRERSTREIPPAVTFEESGYGVFESDGVGHPPVELQADQDSDRFQLYGTDAHGNRMPHGVDDDAAAVQFVRDLERGDTRARILARRLIDEGGPIEDVDSHEFACPDCNGQLMIVSTSYNTLDPITGNVIETSGNEMDSDADVSVKCTGCDAWRPDKFVGSHQIKIGTRAIECYREQVASAVKGLLKPNPLTEQTIEALARKHADEAHAKAVADACEAEEAFGVDACEEHANSQPKGGDK